MDKIIGREAEQIRLGKILLSKDAELVAVYGRRRVGKTFLIRNFFEKQLFNLSKTLRLNKILRAKSLIFLQVVFSNCL